MKNLEKKIGVPKLYFVCVGIIVVVGLLFVNVVAGLIANLVGFVYPAYASFQALETPDDKDDKLWLTYWVVYAFFNILEYFSDWLLFWLPFYFFLKLIFLVYLFIPQYKGAVVIYDNVLGPFLRKHKSQIDREINEFTDKAKKVGRDLANNPQLKNAANKVANEATAAIAREAINQSLNPDEKKNE